MLEAYQPYLQGCAYERLSRLYREGLGTKANPKRADEYLQKAFALNNRHALYQRASLLLQQGQTASALPILKNACKAGLASAIYRLGTLVLAGDGVPLDPYVGYELIRRAAEGGEVDAMVALADAALQKASQAPSVDIAIRYAEMAEECDDPRAAKLLERLSAMQDSQETTAPAESGAARPL